MDHTTDEIGFFIQQITLSLASFNVSQEDVTSVENNLTSLFGVRCAPPTSVFGNKTAELQSIYLADNCPFSANDTYASYARAVRPTVANDTLAANTTFATSTNTNFGTLTGTTTKSGSTTTRTAAATISPTSRTTTVTSSSSSGAVNSRRWNGCQWSSCCWWTVCNFVVGSQESELLPVTFKFCFYTLNGLNVVLDNDVCQVDDSLFCFMP